MRVSVIGFLPDAQDEDVAGAHIWSSPVKVGLFYRAAVSPPSHARSISTRVVTHAG
jgi:hypothetical protein